MVDKLPYRMFHVSQPHSHYRSLYANRKWVIEAWRGEITQFSNVLFRADTLHEVKHILDALPIGSIALDATTRIMTNGVMQVMRTDDDWVLAILGESQDGL